VVLDVELALVVLALVVELALVVLLVLDVELAVVVVLALDVELAVVVVLVLVVELALVVLLVLDVLVEELVTPVAPPPIAVVVTPAPPLDPGPNRPLSTPPHPCAAIAAGRTTMKQAATRERTEAMTVLRIRAFRPFVCLLTLPGPRKRERMRTPPCRPDPCARCSPPFAPGASSW
jgi:hypothetical protein